MIEAVIVFVVVALLWGWFASNNDDGGVSDYLEELKRQRRGE